MFWVLFVKRLVLEQVMYMRACWVSVPSSAGWHYLLLGRRLLGERVGGWANMDAMRGQHLRQACAIPDHRHGEAGVVAHHPPLRSLMAWPIGARGTWPRPSAVAAPRCVTLPPVMLNRANRLRQLHGRRAAGARPFLKRSPGGGRPGQRVIFPTSNTRL